MKISYRIILVNLLIIAVVLGSSTIAFYSIMYNTLTSQQSKNLINSSRNFIFAYRSLMNDIDEEFWNYAKNNTDLLFSNRILSGGINDFFFEAAADSQNIIRYAAKSLVEIPKKLTIDEFVKLNPYAVINLKTLQGNKIYYYGKIINSSLLDDFSKRIGSDIALLWDDITTEISNYNSNFQNLYFLSEANKKLQKNNSLEVFVSNTETADIIAAQYKIDKPTKFGNELSIIIFKSISEVSDLRRTLTEITIIIGVVGIIIALLLSY
ncbi:MAG: hypothetical protein PHY57_06735, partial [Ignavibacterium sp.]|nr:hypothetical protein [Ignavibacterium sp.]